MGNTFYSITQQVFHWLHEVKECSIENGKKKKNQPKKCGRIEKDTLDH